MRRGVGPVRAVVVAAGLSTALLLPAGPALADSPATPDPASLPGLAQVNNGIRQSGCLKGSGATSARVPWAQTFLRPDEVWPLTQGAGVTVAVVGSGVDDAAGALTGRLGIGARAWGTSTSAQDCVGHGTFVAGLIAAGRRPGVGFSGLAPQANILAVGVTDDTGNTTADVLAKGIRTAADGGARVIDIAAPAVGGSGDLAAAVQYARAKGALLVAPAGMDGGGARGAQVYPAGYPGVLAVSDLGPGGAPSKDAPGSGQRVDLMAPGDAVMSTGPGGAGYFTSSGPSFAAAYVAGTAALVLGHQPELTGDQLLHRLEATAYHPGTVLPDPRLGYGAVDPVAAVTAFVPGEAGSASPPAPRSGESMALPPPVDGTVGRSRALLVGGIALVVVLAVGALAFVLPRGRSRGWRPARFTDRLERP